MILAKQPWIEACFEVILKNQARIIADLEGRDPEEVLQENAKMVNDLHSKFIESLGEQIGPDGIAD